MRAAAEDPYAYAIIDATGHAVGYFTLLRIVPQMRVIEVGHVLYSPALQRTPLGTEAQYLLARYVFETLGYRRYEWKCNSFNAPSRRAALRYGFNYEGTFRNYIIAKGRNRDDAWFSMLDSEWPARKASFERWLAPENFDCEGRQKIGLAALNGSRSDAAPRHAMHERPVGIPSIPRRRALARAGDAEGPLRHGGAARSGARCRSALGGARRASAGIWTYISSAGPFADEIAFTAWLVDRKTENDPYFFAVLDQNGLAVGLLAFMAIRPEMRVVEIGSIVYGPRLQRTPLATETQYLSGALCLRNARLPALRMEMRFTQRGVPARRVALWFHLRGNFSPAHDHQGTNARYCMVFHNRQRMAGAQSEFRALAGAGQFRRARAARRSA